MGILNKYNKGKAFDYDNEKTRYFIKPAELKEGGKYPIHAMFINDKSKFGKSPVIFTDEYMVNAPSHMLDIVEEMMNDDDVVQLVNNRRAFFKVYTYKNKFGTQYGIEFIEE